MARKKSPDYWVSPREDGNWEVKRAGAKRASAVLGTQREAEKRAGQLAEKSGGERIMQAKSGKIRSKDSFGKRSARQGVDVRNHLLLAWALLCSNQAMTRG
jgi:hypothetical protein